ncbi:putative SMC N superfamily protein [Candidatus Termititenax persephonae]|uniref:SMC N superfamily protein n=1 Tax=Candidatus Termititenax persephonae TaxID=2218525 RepID=A0A388TF89_9BACT|nr:putative SMC N superfamily protein [Candidatus Termititenax persephonae]
MSEINELDNIGKAVFYAQNNSIQNPSQPEIIELGELQYIRRIADRQFHAVIDDYEFDEITSLSQEQLTRLYEFKDMIENLPADFVPEGFDIFHPDKNAQINPPILRGSLINIFYQYFYVLAEIDRYVAKYKESHPNEIYNPPTINSVAYAEVNQNQKTLGKTILATNIEVPAIIAIRYRDFLQKISETSGAPVDLSTQLDLLELIQGALAQTDATYLQAADLATCFYILNHAPTGEDYSAGLINVISGYHHARLDLFLGTNESKNVPANLRISALADGFDRTAKATWGKIQQQANAINTEVEPEPASRKINRSAQILRNRQEDVALLLLNAAHLNESEYIYNNNLLSNRQVAYLGEALISPVLKKLVQGEIDAGDLRASEEHNDMLGAYIHYQNAAAWLDLDHPDGIAKYLNLSYIESRFGPFNDNEEKAAWEKTIENLRKKFEQDFASYLGSDGGIAVRLQEAESRIKRIHTDLEAKDDIAGKLTILQNNQKYLELYYQLEKSALTFWREEIIAKAATLQDFLDMAQSPAFRTQSHEYLDTLPAIFAEQVLRLLSQPQNRVAAAELRKFQDILTAAYNTRDEQNRWLPKTLDPNHPVYRLLASLREWTPSPRQTRDAVQPTVSPKIVKTEKSVGETITIPSGVKTTSEYDGVEISDLHNQGNPYTVNREGYDNALTGYDNLKTAAENAQDAYDDAVTTLLDPASEEVEAKANAVEAATERVEEAAERVGEAEERVGEAEERVREAEERIEELEERVREAEERVGEMEERVGEMEERVGEMEERAGEAEERVGEAEERVGEAEERVGEAEERVGEAEERIGEAEERVGETGERVGEAEERVGETEERVGEAEERVGEAEERVGEMEERVGEMEERVGELEERVGEAEEKVGEAEEEVTSVESAFNEGDVGLPELENARDALQNAQDILQNAQDALQNAQDTLKNAQDTLKNDQDTLKNAQDALKDTQDALQNDQDALKDTQDALQNDQDALKDTQDALQNTQDILQNAQTTLTNADIAWQNAKDIFAAAQEAWTAALTTLASAQGNLTAAQEALPTVQNALAEAQAALVAAQAALQTAIGTLQAAQEALVAAQGDSQAAQTALQTAQDALLAIQGQCNELKQAWLDAQGAFLAAAPPDLIDYATLLTDLNGELFKDIYIHNATGQTIRLMDIIAGAQVIDTNGKIMGFLYNGVIWYITDEGKLVDTSDSGTYKITLNDDGTFTFEFTGDTPTLILGGREVGYIGSTNIMAGITKVISIDQNNDGTGVLHFANVTEAFFGIPELNPDGTPVLDSDGKPKIRKIKDFTLTPTGADEVTGAETQEVELTLDDIIMLVNNGAALYLKGPNGAKTLSLKDIVGAENIQPPEQPLEVSVTQQAGNDLLDTAIAPRGTITTSDLGKAKGFVSWGGQTATFESKIDYAAAGVSLNSETGAIYGAGTVTIPVTYLDEKLNTVTEYHTAYFPDYPPIFDLVGSALPDNLEIDFFSTTPSVHKRETFNADNSIFDHYRSGSYDGICLAPGKYYRFDDPVVVAAYQEIKEANAQQDPSISVGYEDLATLMALVALRKKYPKGFPSDQKERDKMREYLEKNYKLILSDTDLNGLSMYDLAVQAAPGIILDDSQAFLFATPQKGISLTTEVGVDYRPVGEEDLGLLEPYAKLKLKWNSLSGTLDAEFKYALKSITGLPSEASFEDNSASNFAYKLGYVFNVSETLKPFISVQGETHLPHNPAEWTASYFAFLAGVQGKTPLGKSDNPTDTSILSLDYNLGVGNQSTILENNGLQANALFFTGKAGLNIGEHWRFGLDATGLINNHWFLDSDSPYRAIDTHFASPTLRPYLRYTLPSINFENGGKLDISPETGSDVAKGNINLNIDLKLTTAKGIVFGLSPRATFTFFEPFFGGNKDLSVDWGGNFFVKIPKGWEFNVGVDVLPPTTGEQPQIKGKFFVEKKFDFFKNH